MHTTTIGKTTFYHNGDFSGEVGIVTETMIRVSVPYDELKAFIAESIRTKKIAQLELATDDEVLGLDSK